MEEKNTSPADFQEPKRESLLTREQFLALSAILEATGTKEERKTRRNRQPPAVSVLCLYP